MDKLQNTFKSGYVSKLKDELRAGISLEKYSSDVFEYNVEAVKSVANIYQPEGLLQDMMSSNSDFEAAMHLFKAYKDLSPLLASTEQFWAYLTHVELFPYMKKRWNDSLTDKSYIEDHWFFGSHGYIRNGLASLWWSVYCSYDSDRENPFELSEILFRNYSFRTTFLTVMLRTQEGLKGILEFLLENPDIINEHFENRGRFIAKYFNLLGASKQLSYLPRDYFKNELQKLKPVLLKVTSREDIQNKDIFQIIKQ